MLVSLLTTNTSRQNARGSYTSHLFPRNSQVNLKHTFEREKEWNKANKLSSFSEGGDTDGATHGWNKVEEAEVGNWKQNTNLEEEEGKEETKSDRKRIFLQMVKL